MINTKSCKKIVLRKVIFMDKRLCILNPMDSGRKIECKTLQDKFNTVGGKTFTIRHERKVLVGQTVMV